MKKSFNLLLFLFISVTSMYAQEYEGYKKLVDTTLNSKFLGFQKNISITVPFEWQKELDRGFPVVVVFDQQNQRSHNYILRTIDYLTSNEQMPSCILVSVESDQMHRYVETLHKASSENGLAEQNEEFLFQELLPLLENDYHASTYRLFIGHSRYGYFTTALMINQPKKVNAVISLSPFFTQKNVDLTEAITVLNAQPFEATKYYRYGIGNDYPEDFSKMENVLSQNENQQFNTGGMFFPAAEHNVTPGLTISMALYEIFENWSQTQAIYFDNAQQDLSIMRSLQEKIKVHYGSSLAFGLGILNGKGWYFYNEKNYVKAIEAWEIMMEAYPNFSEGYLYLMDAQIQLGLDTSKTLENFKSSLAKTEIYSDSEKQELLQELQGMEL